MNRLRKAIARRIDIAWAFLATYLARRGMAGMGKLCLKIDDLAEPDEKLPLRVRTKLAAAVGWQEGTQGLKSA